MTIAGVWDEDRLTCLYTVIVRAYEPGVLEVRSGVRPLLRFDEDISAYVSSFLRARERVERTLAAVTGVAPSRLPLSYDGGLQARVLVPSNQSVPAYTERLLTGFLVAFPDTVSGPPVCSG